MLLPALRFFTSHTRCAGIQTARPPSSWGLLEGTDLSGGSDGKENACSAGDPGSIPETERSPGEGNGHPPQNSCLENPTDRGAWRATVHGVAKRRTRQSDSLTHTYTHTHTPGGPHPLCCAFLDAHTHTPWRAGYSPWGRKASNTTERHTHTHPGGRHPPCCAFLAPQTNIRTALGRAFQGSE